MGESPPRDYPPIIVGMAVILQVTM